MNGNETEEPRKGRPPVGRREVPMGGSSAPRSTDERLHALEDSIRIVGGNVAKIAAAQNALADAVGELRTAEPAGAHSRTSLLKGAWWKCEGCGAHLGIQEGDTLRIKSNRGETNIEFVSAPGAIIRCTCRVCGRVNAVECSGK